MSFQVGRKLVGWHEVAVKVVRLVSSLADVPVELDVWQEQVGLALRDEPVNALKQALALLDIEVAGIFVHKFQVGGLIVFGFVIAALQTPGIGPVR